MPKIKTNRAAAKRFRFTSTGKIKRIQANKRHLLTSKSSKRKRNLRGTVLVHDSDARNVSRMLPNG